MFGQVTVELVESCVVCHQSELIFDSRYWFLIGSAIKSDVCKTDYMRPNCQSLILLLSKLMNMSQINHTFDKHKWKLI